MSLDLCYFFCKFESAMMLNDGYSMVLNNCSMMDDILHFQTYKKSNTNQATFNMQHLQKHTQISRKE